MLKIETEGKPVTFIKERALIKPNDEKRGRYKSENLDLYIETDFDKNSTENAIHDGVVVTVPENKYGIKAGDHVYCHHFLTDPENKVEVDGEELSILKCEDIYCKIEDGKILMFGDWNFVEPMLEQEENYKTKSGIFIKPEADTLHRQGVLKYSNPDMDSIGAGIGDVVCFNEVCEYEIPVEGKTYYRMMNEDLCGVIAATPA